MEQTPQYVIEMNHITKEFPGIKANDDITLQLSEAERTGDGSLKNRPETVVSRSSIIIKPSDPVERNSHAPTAETIRWKSHSAPLEAGPSDARHITVRNAWKSRRDLNSSEDSPARVGRHVESPNPHTQRSSTDCSDPEQPSSYLSEQGTRRGGTSGDAPELASRRTQSSLTVSEVFTRRSRAGDTIPPEVWNHLAGTVGPASPPCPLLLPPSPFPSVLSSWFSSAPACVTRDAGDFGVRKH